MLCNYHFAGYTRISVDEELDRDNVSIENQKAIIEDFVKARFPGSTLDFFEDRDRSGYTFEQREGYQKMRRGLMSHEYDILVVKDFSRFSRRNSRGLVELEDLRDAGVRIISIGDGIDFPNDDDWLKIQFQFLINEMPVTDTSKKVRNVIKRRQKDGQWICAAPFGYVVTPQKKFEIVPVEAEIVRKIYSLYLDGWGYKRISLYLTENNYPTPRMVERERKEAAGFEYKRKCRPEWAIISVQHILENDFYIGTFRQGKYTREKINGKDVKIEPHDQIVIEDHHEGIVSKRDFAAVQAMRDVRTRGKKFYVGIRKYDNVYSGLLECGDCGHPMFALSQPHLREAYHCGRYHKFGLRSGCTSHHIRADRLDELLKMYVRILRTGSEEMLQKINESLKKERVEPVVSDQSVEEIEKKIQEMHEELKVVKRQRVRDILRHPDNEDLLTETYDDLENDIIKRVEMYNTMLKMQQDRHNTVAVVNRVAKDVFEVLDEILAKDRLTKRDVQMIVERIKVFEDRIEVKLRPNIDMLLQGLTEVRVDEKGEQAKSQKETVAAMAPMMLDGNPMTLVQTAAKRPDRLFIINNIYDGDPLEIYTDKDGEVIFKKYSLMGGLSDFAAQMCETLNKTTGRVCVITDRDSCIAVSGAPRRDLMEKRLSERLERILEGRKIYQYQPGEAPMPISDEANRFFVICAAPILAEGDVLGSVLIAGEEGELGSGETEYKLLQTMSGFLGRHMEG